MAVDFQPVYLRPNEYAAFGLPDNTQVSNIDQLVYEASTEIDEHCGRKNKDSIGSLLYTTYTERKIIVSDYNLVRLSQRPLAAIPQQTVTDLQTLANAAPTFSGSNLGYYNDIQPNTQKCIDLTLSPLISASGRYGYRRRGQSHVYPDLNMGMNTLQVATTFGGPPAWTVIDLTLVSVDVQTGECWFPAGLYLAQYTELVVTYNSGFDPRYLPRTIKNATAMLVRNYLVRAGNTSGIRQISGVGRITTLLSENVMDDNIKKLLRGYCSVRAM